MKAAVSSTVNVRPLDVLQIKDVEEFVPNGLEVLIKVRTANHLAYREKRIPLRTYESTVDIRQESTNGE
jgi:hypothetical protein